MRTLFSFLTLLICLFGYSQCFNCAKNYGNWVNDNVTDIKKI